MPTAADIAKINLNDYDLDSIADYSEEIKTGISLAIEYAAERGHILCSYASPIEDERMRLTADEAKEIAREDPSLVYVLRPRDR